MKHWWWKTDSRKGSRAFCTKSTFYRFTAREWKPVLLEDCLREHFNTNFMSIAVFGF